MDVCRLCYVAHHSSREFLPSVTRLSVFVKPRQRGSHGPLGAVAPLKKSNFIKIHRKKSALATTVLSCIQDVPASTTCFRVVLSSTRHVPVWYLNQTKAAAFSGLSNSLFTNLHYYSTLYILRYCEGCCNTL